MFQNPKNHFPANYCTVCGHKNCSQSIDHSFLSFKELRNIVQNAKIANQHIDEIKKNINLFYESLKDNLITMLNNDHAMMQQHINRYYYHYMDFETINIKDLCKFANDNYSILPTKKIQVLIRKIHNEQEKKLMGLSEDGGFQEIEYDIEKYLKQFSISNSIKTMKDHLPYSYIILKSQPPLQLRRSLSSISNPQVIDEQINKSYTFKNVTIKSKTKILQISNKKITDQQLLRQMPIISSFKNINVFEIRNNRITSFGCRIIAGMKQIKTLDIRGNRVGDEGIAKIVEGLPNLQSFMISQTGCTNVSAQIIVDKMHHLQMFWCQHNQIDGQHALRIANKVQLRVISFAGNNIDELNAQKIKKVVSFKGYVVL